MENKQMTVSSFKLLNGGGAMLMEADRQRPVFGGKLLANLPNESLK